MTNITPCPTFSPFGIDGNKVKTLILTDFYCLFSPFDNNDRKDISLLPLRFYSPFPCAPSLMKLVQFN
jgi:hypothetical protein